MGNCLKTQLKEVVDNDNLFPIGCLSIFIERVDTATPENSLIKIGNSISSSTIEVVGDGYIANRFELLSQHVKSITNSGSTVNIYMSEDVTQLRVSNKYELTTLIAPSGRMATINLNEFYTPHLPSINDFNIPVFDTKALKHCQGLISFYALPGAAATGDMSFISSTPLITRFEVVKNNTGFNITGNIEDIVSAFYDNGRTSSSSTSDGLQMLAPLHYLTFGGKQYLNIASDTRRAWLQWESKEKIFIIQTDADSYSSSTAPYIFERGYSSSEIQIWQAAGKTVIDVVSGTVYPPNT